MAVYRISGVWKDPNNTITHYAMHLVTQTGVERAVKTSKARAVEMLRTGSGNIATTWLWNYRSSQWVIGENVEVVRGAFQNFLRSSPDNQISDNLAHLIDYDWIAP